MAAATRTTAATAATAATATTGSVVALGERALVEPYALAGAVVRPAETPGDVIAAWRALPADTLVVLLTQRAAQVLADAPTAPSASGGRGGLLNAAGGSPGPMTVVLPGNAP